LAEQQTVIQEEIKASPEKELQIVGKPVRRVDGLEKITGSAIFAYDMELPRMLYGKIHRSRFPHAEIVKLNIEKALKVPGVDAILTGNDVSDGLRGRGLLDTPILAREKVRYVGEPIAAVAAESLEAAEEASDLIEVEYKELPAVFDPEEAMRENPKVVIHPNIANYKRLKAQIYKAVSDPTRPNITNYFKVRKGSVDEGFKRADLIIEHSHGSTRTH
jgi:CO/xanthine dehydrogenase Mo-binding subunit